MAKSKISTKKLVWSIIAAVFGIMLFVMMFLPIIKIKELGISCSAINIVTAMGMELTEFATASEGVIAAGTLLNIESASLLVGLSGIVSIIAGSLGLLAAIFAILGLFLKKPIWTKLAKIFGIIAFVFAIAALIMVVIQLILKPYEGAELIFAEVITLGWALYVSAASAIGLLVGVLMLKKASK